MANTKNRVILLVEDNADDELLTIRALKQNKILNEVVVARDGAEALDYLFGTGPHAGRDVADLPAVILLDLGLPRIDGHEVLRRIRADERTKSVPVVILTASSEEEDVTRGYALGANAYVVKPINFAKYALALQSISNFWTKINEPPHDSEIVV